MKIHEVNNNYLGFICLNVFSPFPQKNRKCDYTEHVVLFPFLEGTFIYIQTSIISKYIKLYSYIT